jgi:hypothetical protein
MHKFREHKRKDKLDFGLNHFLCSRVMTLDFLSSRVMTLDLPKNTGFL